MKTLNEITYAVRTNQAVSVPELRWAVIACDVLMAQLHVENDVAQMTEFFKACNLPVDEYAGPANDPKDPDVVAWYEAGHSVGEIQ